MIYDRNAERGNDMDYFKHDINASEDDKICELLATGGYELLGYYWRFVEYLYSRGGKVNKSKLKGVAWSLHMDVDKLLSLINDYTLFLQEDDIVYSKNESGIIYYDNRKTERYYSMPDEITSIENHFHFQKNINKDSYHFNSKNENIVYTIKY
jgi:hypothetical protein